MSDSNDKVTSGSAMAIALEEARAAADRGEVPVGAVVSDARTGRVLSRAGNRVEELSDPTAHAEILAIRSAAAVLGAPRLTNCHLTVTWIFEMGESQIGRYRRKVQDFCGG